MNDLLEGTLPRSRRRWTSRLTARQLAESAVARHDRLDGTLQAYTTWAPDQALARAGAADAAFWAGIRNGPF